MADKHTRHQTKQEHVSNPRVKVKFARKDNRDSYALHLLNGQALLVQLVLMSIYFILQVEVVSVVFKPRVLCAMLV